MQKMHTHKTHTTRGCQNSVYNSYQEEIRHTSSQKIIAVLILFFFLTCTLWLPHCHFSSLKFLRQDLKILREWLKCMWRSFSLRFGHSFIFVADEDVLCVGSFHHHWASFLYQHNFLVFMLVATLLPYLVTLTSFLVHPLCVTFLWDPDQP